MTWHQSNRYSNSEKYPSRSAGSSLNFGAEDWLLASISGILGSSRGCWYWRSICASDASVKVIIRLEAAGAGAGDVGAIGGVAGEVIEAPVGAVLPDWVWIAEGLGSTMEFHGVQVVGQRGNAEVDWLGTLTKLCPSSEGSSLSADGESILEMLKKGLVSKGLVEKARDEPVSISDAS